MPYAVTTGAGASYALTFNGQDVVLTYNTGPDGGAADVLLDGAPLLDRSGEPVILDTYQATVRYNVSKKFSAPEPGEHTLTLVNRAEANPASAGTRLTLVSAEVLPPIRHSSLPLIIGMLLAVQLAGIIFAVLLGRPLFSRLAEALDTKRSVLLALLIYSVIAIWGFALDSTAEFWFLSWMVAIVQGGSQALSRSLYASMSPAAKSGEFFGLYGVMEKFSAIIGPLLFAAAVAIFDSSRPAILSLIALFIIGGYLLTRVNVAEGRRVAQAEDAAALGASS